MSVDPQLINLLNALKHQHQAALVAGDYGRAHIIELQISNLCVKYGIDPNSLGPMPIGPPTGDGSSTPGGQDPPAPIPAGQPTQPPKDDEHPLLTAALIVIAIGAGIVGAVYYVEPDLFKFLGDD